MSQTEFASLFKTSQSTIGTIVIQGRNRRFTLAHDLGKGKISKGWPQGALMQSGTLRSQHTEAAKKQPTITEFTFFMLITVPKVFAIFCC